MVTSKTCRTSITVTPPSSPHFPLQAAREQRLLAEACLTHELAELVREANRELEATASAVEAARAKMVTLAADMQAATAEAQAAQRELQGGAAVVPPAERLRHRRRLVRPSAALPCRALRYAAVFEPAVHLPPMP